MTIALCWIRLARRNDVADPKQNLLIFSLCYLKNNN